ncbi:MAG: zinc ribbon domain-containing protein, partial [Phycisphaerae bacterium]
MSEFRAAAGTANHKPVAIGPHSEAGGARLGEKGDYPAHSVTPSASRPPPASTPPIPPSGPDWRQRRPKHLFSGLIKCASCGGGMTLISRVYYGCAANRNKGTCNNRLTIRLDRLEEAVLRGLQENLVTPEL